MALLKAIGVHNILISSSTAVLGLVDAGDAGNLCVRYEC